MATQTIACNENNDMYLVDGRNIAMLNGAEACAQNLLQRSLERLGENQFNTTEGVDYFGTIFTPQPDYDAARQSLSTNLLACPDVIAINALTITIDGDQFQYEADCQTIYGPVSISNFSNS